MKHKFRSLKIYGYGGYYLITQVDNFAKYKYKARRLSLGTHDTYYKLL